MTNVIKKLSINEMQTRTQPFIDAEFKIAKRLK